MLFKGTLGSVLYLQLLYVLLVNAHYHPGLVARAATEGEKDQAFYRDLADFISENKAVHSPKRAAPEVPRVVSLAWNATNPRQVPRQFNLSVYFEGCTRLLADTKLGTYRFSNGSTRVATTASSLLLDLNDIKTRALDLTNAKIIITNRTLAFARDVLERSKTLLDSGIICPPEAVGRPVLESLLASLEHVFTGPADGSFIRSTILVGASSTDGFANAVGYHQLQTDSELVDILSANVTARGKYGIIPVPLLPAAALFLTFSYIVGDGLINWYDGCDAALVNSDATCEKPVFSFGQLYLINIVAVRLRGWLDSVHDIAGKKPANVNDDSAYAVAPLGYPLSYLRSAQARTCAPSTSLAGVFKERVLMSIDDKDTVAIFGRGKNPFDAVCRANDAAPGRSIVSADGA